MPVTLPDPPHALRLRSNPLPHSTRPAGSAALTAQHAPMHAAHHHALVLLYRTLAPDNTTLLDQRSNTRDVPYKMRPLPWPCAGTQ